ncbi:MAG TPA: aldo/keto reductase [Candidatus Eisenbergiella intestinipullorum]|nr:aldo/keto reductase [Candidatus Eisenbergiella intestinipullorum]
MQKISFIPGGPEVSVLALGTAQYGTGISEADAFRQMDMYTERGGNFLDTALVYGDWGCEERGRSEQVIGRWLASRRKRPQVIISTKGCHPPINDMADSRVNAQNIREDVQLSLKNLGCGWIDLYFLHRDDPKVPAGELLEALEEEVRKGNIRFYGCSNWSLKRVKEAAGYAAAHGLRGFICNQIMFTLADVNKEVPGEGGMLVLDREFYRYHKETQLGLMAYMCQAGGYFTKRAQGRPVSEYQERMYGSKKNERILQELLRLRQEGYRINDLVLQYVMAAEFPAVPIGGFRTFEQLQEGMEGVERRLPKEVLQELIEIKRQ